MKEDKSKIAWKNFSFILLGTIIGMIFTAGLFFISDYSNKIPLLQVNFDENNDCNKLNLVDTANCLRNQINKFYKYNITNIEKELTLEEFKNEGGVCSHATDWFKEKVETLGFNFKDIKIETDRKYGHELGIMSNEEGYCVLDQDMWPYCVHFKNETEDSLEYEEST